MTKGFLRPQDWGDFEYDFGRTLSIFFAEPLRLEVPGVGEGTLGMGFGGLAASLFQRGFYCTACGNCCYGDERVWLWLPPFGPQVPYDTQFLTVFVNGKPLVLRVHVNARNAKTEGCDYLDRGQTLTFDGQPSRGQCTLWAQGKTLPHHCRQLPDMAVYAPNSLRGRVPLLSRRLPPRNWQSPKCPIPVTEIPLDPATIRKDWDVWQTWVVALQDLPGCYVKQAFELWWAKVQEVRRGRPAENLYFADQIDRKSSHIGG